MRTPPYPLVIFDCDGVLVDSEPIANRVLAEALNAIGLSISFDEVCREMVGLSLPACVELVQRRLGRDVPPDFLADLQRRTFDAFRQGLQPVPGVAAALDAIEAEICVASSGEPEKIRLTLGLTGLLPRFQGRLFSASEVARGKPAPDLFVHAAQCMGFDARDCAVVEDSVPGAQAGVAAGMQVFGYCQRSTPARMAEAGAIVFDDMADLPRLLGEPTAITRTTVSDG